MLAIGLQYASGNTLETKRDWHTAGERAEAQRTPAQQSPGAHSAPALRGVMRVKGRRGPVGSAHTLTQ